MTLFIAAAIFARLCRAAAVSGPPERTDREFGNGRIRLTALWNEGAAFSLPLKRGWVVLLSILILPFVWLFRRRNPIGAGTGAGRRAQQSVGACALWTGLRLCPFSQAPQAMAAMSGICGTSAIVLGGTLLALLDRKK